MMKYHNIRVKIDWEASSYYGMTANVKMLDNSFDKYIAHADRNTVFWGNSKLFSYYDGIPYPQQGRIMTSKKRGTDFLQKRGMVYGFSSLVAIVSQDFINVLNSIGVDSNEYILKTIDIVNSEKPYYFFFVPKYDYASFDLEKTVFHDMFNKKDNRTFCSVKDAECDRDYLPQIITIKTARHSKDLINCAGVASLFVSDRVLKGLTDAGVEGFEIDEKYQLTICEYEQSNCKNEIHSDQGTIISNPVVTKHDEGNDEQFDKLLAELFIEYFSKISSLRRHEVLVSWNYDNPKSVLEFVVSQPDTDIATAQMIYWRLEPESVRDCEDEDDMPILKIIEQNIGRGFYVDNGFAYNPRDDEGYDAVQNNTDHTSEEAYLPDLIKTREGIIVEGITESNGIPKELYPAYANLICSFGLEEEYL